MKKLESHFLFNRQQRDGILLLILFICLLLGIYYFVDFKQESVWDVSSPEFIILQKELDSLRTAELESRKPKIFPFNPNFITDFKAYTLGMSPVEFDRLKAFREQGRWINSIRDFKNVTKVQDSLLAEMSPLFKFPEWVTNPRPKRQFVTNQNDEKSYASKVDLNKATRDELQQISGIGPALSERIVAYRDRLGGFSNDVQLGHVYGLRQEVVKRTLKQFTVKSPRHIEKMDVNTASVSDLATLPGISYELAKTIWEFRRLRERLSNLSELQKIEGIDERKFQLIELYLSAE